MLKAFQELGALVSANVVRSGMEPDVFMEAATTALLKSNIFDTVDPDEIAFWLATSENIPQQHGKDFGQPAVDVYRCQDFYIQVLLWADSTTAIHEHAFAGAFGVLAGSSVHSQYEFELQKELSRELRLGNLKFVSSELLRKGDVRPIHSGSTFIHALFHLDRPSVSVVIRTEAMQLTQYSYLKPHIAFDAYHQDKLSDIKLHYLESLRVCRSNYFWQYATLLLAKGSAWNSFRIMSHAYPLAKEFPKQWQQLLLEATAKYGAQTMKLMISSIIEEERSRKLQKLRSLVYDVDYRFFLALLLNVPTRDVLFSLLAQRCNTEDPKAIIIRWLREMFQKGLLASKFDPRILDVIDLIVLHGTFAKAQASVRRVQDQPAHLCNEETLKKLWAMVRSISFLKPLFESEEDNETDETSLGLHIAVQV